MRTIKIVAIAVSALLGVLSLNQAQAGGGVLKPGIRAGYYTDHNDFFLGLDIKTSLPLVSVNPNIEYVFVDNGKLATFNLDGTIGFGLLPFISTWAGAGLGLIYADPDNADADTEGAFNLLLGVAPSKIVPLDPYLQFKYIFADKNEGFVVGAGIHF